MTETAALAHRAAAGKAENVKRRLAFASPEVSITILYATVNSWYLYYLINIADIAPFIAGMAFAAGRIFDAGIDPLIGRWIDARPADMGRKHFIKVALLPAAIAFASIWIAPTLVDNEIVKAICAGLVFWLFALAYSLANVTRLSMLPRYEADYHGRTAQIAVDMGVNFITLLLVIAGVPALISLMDGANQLAGTSATSWWIVTGCLATIACIAYLPFLIWVPDQHSTESRRSRATLTSFFGVPEIPLTLIVFLLSVISLALVQSMLPFFLESYVGIPKNGHAPVLGAVFLVSFVALPIWVRVGRKVGKRVGLMTGLSVFLVFLAIVATIEVGSGLSLRLFLAALFAGASVAALNVFPWAMVPDAADQYLKATGRTGEGLSASIFMFFNQLGASSAVLVNGALLSFGGHVRGQAEQSEQTIQVIYSAMVFLPLLLAMLCLVAAIGLSRGNKPTNAVGRRDF